MTQLLIDPTFNTGTKANPSIANDSDTAIANAISTFGSAYAFYNLQSAIEASVDFGKDIYVTTEQATSSSSGDRFDEHYVPGHYTVEDGFSTVSQDGPVAASYPIIDYENSADSLQDSQGAGFIYLGSGILASSNHTLTYANRDGGTFEGSLLRTIVHELGHAATISFGYEQTWRTEVGGGHRNYGEEIAVFVENAFYVPYAQSLALADAQYRIGHLSGYPLLTSEGGVVGVGYFEGMDSPYIRLTENRDAEFSSTGFSADYTSYEIITKTYHHVGYEVLGQAYDRYTTVVGQYSDGVFSHDPTQATVINTRFADHVIPETITRPIDDAVEDVRLAILANQHVVDAPHDDAASDDMTSTMLSDMGYDGIAGMVALDQTRTFSLAADRFFDRDDAQNFFDVAGPTASHSQAGPSVVTIDDRLLFDDNPDYGTQYEGTVIVGGGGYHQGFVDLSGSTDQIQAGDGDDLLIAGTGGTSAVPNYLFGNVGNDILVGGPGTDVLNGGDGADLFVENPNGDDILYGGDGFDVASYASPSYTSGIYYHGNLGTVSANGFGVTDTLAQIEAVIGSPNADTFYSNGDHVMMVGGGGDDVFYLQNRDVVVGGDGADVFNVSVKTGTPATDQRILIMGFDQNDQLWIDGQRFHGSVSSTQGTGGDAVNGYLDATVTFTSNGGADPFASSYQMSDPNASSDYWTDVLTRGTPNDDGADDLLSLITIRHIVNGSVASSTQIYMTGFKPGDGQIDYSAPTTDDSSPTLLAGHHLYGDVQASDPSYGHHLDVGYPVVESYFQAVEPFI